MINSRSRRLAMLATIAAGVLPAAAAQAQYYAAAGAQQPPPLYPYVVQSNQPYAVQVAPGTYVIQRPAAAQPRPSRAASKVRKPAPKKTAAAGDRPRKPVDHALVDELRKRASGKSNPKGNVINTTKVVREKPTVIETTRVVDDPPRVVDRYHVVEGTAPPPRQQSQAVTEAPKRPSRDDNNKKRVIRAEAEITILGPDRMSIRLFRRGESPNARAD